MKIEEYVDEIAAALRDGYTEVAIELSRQFSKEHPWTFIDFLKFMKARHNDTIGEWLDEFKDELRYSINDDPPDLGVVPRPPIYKPRCAR